MKGYLGGKILVSDNFELFPTGERFYLKHILCYILWCECYMIVLARQHFSSLWFSLSWSLGNVLEFRGLLKQHVKQLTSLNWFYLLKIDCWGCWLITPWVIIQRKNCMCPRRNTWPQVDPGAKIFSLQNSKRNVAPKAIYKVRRPSIRKTWLPVTWVADMD